jgi:methyl-accepting chemotaxis protein
VGEIATLNQHVQVGQQQTLDVCKMMDARSGELRQMVASFCINR